MTDTPLDADPVYVSVVVAAHDAASTIRAQLTALLARASEVPYEIVVVDNGSTDATPAILGDFAGRIRVVRATDGRGPAYARNVGARAAHGRTLAFCDADDVVDAGWIDAMGRALSAYAFVCGPVELDLLNPTWLAGSRGTTGTSAAAVFDGAFPFASSCNMGIDRAQFLAIGGFDEQLAVGEDIDLSMRLHLAGVPLYFAGDAVVHYRYRPTLGSTFDRAIAYGAARPLIAERWRGRGGEPLSRGRGARNWLWLVRHIGLLRSRAGTARWVWVAGQRLGSLRGSWRVRRLYL